MGDGPPRGDAPRFWRGAIWLFAAGYFACYAPYSALTRALSKGLLPGMHGGFSGFVLLPISTMASLAGMFVFITAIGWWKHAGRRRVLGVEMPFPGKWTFLSGLCTAGIIGTTTLAYTFGPSIVFMMLLMRGGVLVIAPVVDFLTGRRVRWFSWLALGLSIASLAAAQQTGGAALTAIATADVFFYVACYFIRLRFMSRLAKTDDPRVTTRYFVEEQMVATPAIVTALAVLALVGAGQIMQDIRRGFTTFWGEGHAATTIMIGVFSQGTGVFGSLVFLDRRENTFCVPVNRASSVLAGVLASYGLMLLLAQDAPPARELVGAAIMIAAMVALSAPDLVARLKPKEVVA